jgi:hypothetical protein
MLKVRAVHSEMLGSAIQLFTAAPDRKGGGGAQGCEVEFINCLFDGCTSGTRDRGQLVYTASGHHTQGARFQEKTTELYDSASGQETRVQLRRFHLKTETEFNLQNIVL